MTHCDFSVRPVRDEMRHIIGSSEPDVTTRSDKDQNRGCKNRDKDHMKYLCELYGAQAACGRYFVHELTSEVNTSMTSDVNTRMKCVPRIVAMPGTTTIVAGRSVQVWISCLR